MANLLPSWDPRRHISRASQIEVHLSRAGARLFRRQTPAKPLLPANEVASAAAVDMLLPHLRRSQTIAVTLDPALCLLRSVSLPTQMMPKAAEILALDATRATPFARDDIVSLWRRVRPGLVEHAIIRKDWMQDVIGRMRSTGVNVTALTIRSEHSPAWPMALDADGNLYGASQDARWLRLAAVAGVAAGLAVAAMLYAGHKRQQDAINSLQALIDDIRPRAVEKQRQLDILEANRARAAALAQQQGKRALMLQAWEEIARLLPDTAWIQGFSIKERAIQIEGSANNAEALIALLESSDTFKGARFAAPVFRNPAGQSSHFAIALELQEGTP